MGLLCNALRYQIDFLLYLLRETLKKRKNFKVIIMSATVNDEIFNNYSQENYTNMFMKYHGPKIGEIMEKLGQKEMLLELQDLDSQRSNIYKEFYSNI